MIPLFSLMLALMKGIPRESGDDPEFGKPVFGNKRYSPRERG